MDVITYTREWLQGEMLLGDGLMIIGGLTLVAVVLLFFFGTSDHARSMILPGLFVAILTLVGGYLISKGTMPRVQEYTKAFLASPMSFLQKEIVRVDSFVNLYKWSTALCGVLILVAVALMIFFKKPWIRGCGVAVLYIGIVLSVTDYFSCENGEQYQAQLHQIYEEAPSLTAQNTIVIEQPVEIP